MLLQILNNLPSLFSGEIRVLFKVLVLFCKLAIKMKSWMSKKKLQNYEYGIYLKCQSNERPKWTRNFGRILSCDSSWTGKRRNKNLTPIPYKRTELRLSSLLNCKLLSRSEIRCMLMSGWQSRPMVKE